MTTSTRAATTQMQIAHTEKQLRQPLAFSTRGPTWLASRVPMEGEPSRMPKAMLRSLELK